LVLNPEGEAPRLDLGGNLKRAAAFERTYDLSFGEDIPRRENPIGGSGME
jgi:hypothetical protein